MRLLLSLLLLAGCQSSAPSSPPASADPSARPPGGPPPGGPAPPEVHGPALPYVAEGACPFECCTYGTWTTTADLPVRVAAGADAPLAFTLDAGTTFEADRGHVLVTRPGLVVADSAFTIYDGPTVLPGDTLYVLDAIGEGYVHVWYQGTVFEASGEPWNWGQAPDRHVPGPFPARQLRPVESGWWAHVRTADGREGWIDMDRAEGGTIEGVDACG